MTEGVLQQNIEEIVREAASFMTRDFTVASKGTIANQVTSSDVAVEGFLKEQLAKLLPGSGFIAEESGQEEGEAEYVWIIDPIDGTANYVRDLASSAISVGLYRNMEPLIGVAYHPYRNELFSARRGAGALQRQSDPCLRAGLCTQPVLYLILLLSQGVCACVRTGSGAGVYAERRFPQIRLCGRRADGAGGRARGAVF